MTRLVRLIRTTAFRLSLAFVALAALVASTLIAVISYQAQNLLREQSETAVQEEIDALSTTYRTTGLRGLFLAVTRRANRPGAYLYLLTNPQGQPLAGNLLSLQPGILSDLGPRLITYSHDDPSDTHQREASVRIVEMPGGFRLVVGRDLAEQARLRTIVVNAAIAAGIVVLAFGLGGGSLVAMRIARRIDDMTASSHAIMAGDLSKRLPLSGSGDEFDRLGGSVNTMLARIEELMRGLKEVSDNIAHDLKTPLTRLRSRVEGALRQTLTGDKAREELSAVLSETDGLIRTFDALLLIARAEGGEGPAGLARIDLRDVVNGIGDLYDVVAEEAGFQLMIEAPGSAVIRGNRELLARALSNLIDNAIKFSRPAASPPPPTITISLALVDGQARLSVSDRGPGILEADRGRVLERFVRLEKSRSKPGTGLGLSLVLAITRLHHGTLLLEDNQPGLRVVITMPLAVPA